MPLGYSAAALRLEPVINPFLASAEPRRISPVLNTEGLSFLPKAETHANGGQRSVPAMGGHHDFPLHHFRLYLERGKPLQIG